MSKCFTDTVALCASPCVTQSGHGAHSSKRVGILSTWTMRSTETKQLHPVSVYCVLVVTYAFLGFSIQIYLQTQK